MTSPTPALDAERRGWFDAAVANISPNRMRDLIVEMVGIPSPTGRELDLARAMQSQLHEAGLKSEVDVIKDKQASTAGVLPGDGSGPSLLLYAPIDTHMAVVPASDTPTVGPTLRFDMAPEATVIDDVVIGLGASNPKGQAACVVAAAEAVAAAGIPLTGDLQIGLGASGMPYGYPSDHRQPAGHGTGCAHLLDHHFAPDFAVIAKPSKGVVWQEVGLAWIRIDVGGEFSYAGTRHRGEYLNPILSARSVIDALELFFADYTETTTQGSVAPQGNLTAVRAGWTERLAYVPAVCELYVDLRLSPHTSPDDALAALEATLQKVRRSNPGLETNTEVLVLVPGTASDENSWVVKSAIAAWEYIEGHPHRPQIGNSGATDGNVLRSRGIPTARMGTPRLGSVPELPDDFSAGMNAIDVGEMVKLTQKLTRTIIDTCTRSREEVGLA